LPVDPRLNEIVVHKLFHGLDTHTKM
jgi:hypothetical protein